MVQEDVIIKIDKYLTSDMHRPIMVDVPSSCALKKIIQHYSIGDNKIIQADNDCYDDRMPLLDSLKHYLTNINEIIFLDGLYYYLFLYGEETLQNELRSLLDLSIKNKLVVLTVGCSRWINSFDRRLFESARIIIQDGTPEDLPTILLWSKSITPPETCICGIGCLSQMSTLLESGHIEVPIITDKKKTDFPYSLCNIIEFSSDYQILSSKYGEIANIGEASGTPEQWGNLRNKMTEYKDLASYFCRLLGNINGLANSINGFAKYNTYTRWAYFIALRIYGAKENDYLSEVVQNSRTYKEFIANSFCTILHYQPNDNNFHNLYKQRKDIVSQMEDYYEDIDSFCKKLYSKREKSLYYLTDNSKREKEMTIELLSQHASDYSQAMLMEILKITYPDLYTYLQPFDFNNEYLNNYFQLYKWSKVTNHIMPELMTLVEEQATKRNYNIWLKTRPSYVEHLHKEKDKDILYFIDALGVEYLGFIQNKCFEKDLFFQADIARCNLPTITSLNKEFVEDFKKSGCKVYDNKDLDNLKHDGSSTYNYENNKLPIHIVEELNILDKLMLQLKTIENDQTAYVIADHGATRLAVINEKENKWKQKKKGKHSGRCCPKSDVDDKPPFATDENKFWCLANYDRFKGGRAAIVETHGGATLEEVLIPIITIRKSKQKIECKLAEESPVIVSFKKKAVLKIFVDTKSDKLSITVNNNNYSAIATEIPYVYNVEMPDIKNAGIYTFNVLLNNMIIAKELSFEVKKEGASERKFF